MSDFSENTLDDFLDDLQSPDTQMELDTNQKVDVRSKLSVGFMVSRLLHGVIYKKDDPTLFLNIIKSRAAIYEYVEQIGLYLVINETENYIFLRSITDEEYENRSIEPKDRPTPILTRRQLSFDVSFLILLLLKRLIEHDKVQSSQLLILSNFEIYDMLCVFYKKESTNAILIKKANATINNIVKLGFLRKVRESGRESYYEVRRILISLLDAQLVSDYDKALLSYLQKLEKENT